MMRLTLIWYTVLVIGCVKGSQLVKGEFELVTCGSTIKLSNRKSGYKLHSHEVKYGSGSGQQSVTGQERADDVNSYWTVRAQQGEYCKLGTAVNCGDVLRLTHATTNTNLHSHHFRSPLSNNQEVSAFGGNGEGDTGDNWQLLCSGIHWERNSDVTLKHIDTGNFLATSTKYIYSRPIGGQLEVFGVGTENQDTKWFADEGMYFKPDKETE